MIAIEYIKDFINLIYPDNCRTCGETLLKNETLICTRCLYDLSKINIDDVRDNIVSRIFWGRVMIDKAFSLYHFNSGGKLQELMHKMKYKGEKGIGYEMGKFVGIRMKELGEFEDIDTIIPVPLHWKKFKKRGYNQSEYLARGISSVLDRPVDTRSLIRNIETSTQTKKIRFERWQNVENIFLMKKSLHLEDKHVLLVDDIVTTGSTLEACSNALLKVKNIKISVSTFAVA